mmetsp:Transcript_46271/g.140290  ORF Transcript_46271/g.140290 Transcript_46271/m.140290 type:complete len:302 (-) Transcript_46271:984-1889(-)
MRPAPRLLAKSHHFSLNAVDSRWPFLTCATKPSSPTDFLGFPVPQLLHVVLRANWWSPHRGQLQSPGRNLSAPPSFFREGDRDLALAPDRDAERAAAAAFLAGVDAATGAAAIVGTASDAPFRPTASKTTMPSPAGFLTTSFGDVGVGSSRTYTGSAPGSAPPSAARRTAGPSRARSRCTSWSCRRPRPRSSWSGSLRGMAWSSSKPWAGTARPTRCPQSLPRPWRHRRRPGRPRRRRARRPGLGRGRGRGHLRGRKTVGRTSSCLAIGAARDAGTTSSRATRRAGAAGQGSPRSRSGSKA